MTGEHSQEHGATGTPPRDTQNIGEFAMPGTCQKSPETTAQLLDVKTVALMCGCSPRHVYRLSDSGKMPRPVKLGALVRWSKTAIESWIGEGCPPVVKRPKGG